MPRKLAWCFNQAELWGRCLLMAYGSYDAMKNMSLMKNRGETLRGRKNLVSSKPHHIVFIMNLSNGVDFIETA